MSLPYVEQGPLYNAINFSLAIETAANSTARLTRINTFLCPSDASFLPQFTVVETPRPARQLGNPICDVASSNYVGCFGKGDPSSLYPYSPTDNPPGRDNGEGLFIRNKSVTIAQILDGTSTTLAAGEKSQNLARATWTGAVTNSAVPITELQAEAASPPRPATPWSSRTPANSTGPNSPPAHADQFWSRHPGGASSSSPTGASGSSRSNARWRSSRRWRPARGKK